MDSSVIDNMNVFNNVFSFGLFSWDSLQWLTSCTQELPESSQLGVAGFEIGKF